MDKQKNALQVIGWRMWLWLPALLVLSNPNLHALDLLPDFIGYALLLVAIRRLALLDAGFAEVKRAFGRMMWFSLARMIGLVWVYTATSAYEQPTLILSICFVLGVLELWIILPACRQLFGSLSYLAMRSDGKLVFESLRARKIERLMAKMRRWEQAGSLSQSKQLKFDRKIRRLNECPAGDITDHLRRSCQVFAVAKTVLCVLPEFAALAYAPYDAGAIRFNWYIYINGFRAISWVVVMVFGIIWLCRTIAYIRHISNDQPFWECVAEKCCEDALLHPERKPLGRLRSAMVLMTVGFIFFVNFRLDGINYLPSFVAPIAFLGALASLACYLPTAVKIISCVAFAAHAVLSAYAWGLSNQFFCQFDLATYNISWHVRDEYARLVTDMAWPEAIATLLSLIALGLVLFTMINRYAASGGASTRCHSSEELTRERKRKIKGYLLFPTILGVFLLAARIVNCYMLPIFEMIWLVDLFVSLAFAAFASLRVFAVKDELRPERMLLSCDEV